jgi:hypothetical protein
MQNMNRYGRQAQTHWAQWRPVELSQIPDQEAFFSTLGLEVAAKVDQLAAELAGNDPAGEDYLAKLGRLRMAKFTAEEQILRELVLLPPEPGHPQAGDQEPATAPGQTSWQPMTISPGDPGYHDYDEDPTLPRNRAETGSNQAP